MLFRLPINLFSNWATLKRVFTVAVRITTAGCGLVLLSGCESTQSRPYQAERPPEQRTSYHGMAGFRQYQRDQVYLLNKELADQCDAAFVDLAIAKSRSDHEAVKLQQEKMARTCV